MGLIMTAFSFLKSGVGRIVAIVAAALAAVAFVFYQGKRAGKQGVEIAASREKNRRVRDAREVARKSAETFSDADDRQLDDELRRRGL